MPTQQDLDDLMKFELTAARLHKSEQVSGSGSGMEKVEVEVEVEVEPASVEALLRGADELMGGAHPLQWVRVMQGLSKAVRSLRTELTDSMARDLKLENELARREAAYEQERQQANARMNALFQQVERLKKLVPDPHKAYTDPRTFGT